MHFTGLVIDRKVDNYCLSLVMINDWASWYSDAGCRMLGTAGGYFDWRLSAVVEVDYLRESVVCLRNVGLQECSELLYTFSSPASDSSHPIREVPNQKRFKTAFLPQNPVFVLEGTSSFRWDLCLARMHNIQLFWCIRRRHRYAPALPTVILAWAINHIPILFEYLVMIWRFSIPSKHQHQ